jgi:hypothetical protein
MVTPSDPVQVLAQRYVRFAAECEGISPLYSTLSAQIAQDGELLTLALACRPGQPPGNLLLGAIHFLLLQQPDNSLAAYYPSLTPQPRPRKEAFAAFKRFCLENQSAIETIISTRLVQTNEIRRCAYLLPAFAQIAQYTTHQGIGEPLALLEIGASAGLNLLWDHYGYHYHLDQTDEIVEAGAIDSAVLLTCAIRGDTRPPLPTTLPPIAWRTGLDLNPIDLRKLEDYRWLRALIWPEHHDRVALLEDAARIYHQHPPRVQQGDVASDLATLLDAMPAYATPVIFHTHVFNQIPPTVQASVQQTLLDFSRERILYRIGNELAPPAIQHFPLTLQIYQDSQMREHHLADVDGHGRWLQWHLI